MKAAGIVLLALATLLVLLIFVGMAYPHILIARGEEPPRPGDVADLISLTLLLGMAAAIIGPLGLILLVVGLIAGRRIPAPGHRGPNSP